MPTAPRPLSEELREAIEQAYRVFERYRLAGALTVCRCDVCMDDEAERALLATPLREISAQLLAEYTNSAHGWNDGTIASDMRYFLPRYLELIANDQPPDHLGFGTALRRLGEGAWRTTWPADEIDALNRYFDALARFVLEHLDAAHADWYPGGVSRFMEVLELVAKAGGDVDRVLQIWSVAPGPAAAIEMAAWRRSVVTEHGAHKLKAIWLEDLPAESERIGAFLMQASVARRIVEAAEATNAQWPLEVLAGELFPDMPGGRQTR